jgi:hypothetical protein
MFSPQVYWRLFESINRQDWALPVALALAALWVLLRRMRRTDRGGLQSAHALVGLLALGWLWVAWAFFWQRFAPIYTAAPAFALLFLVQGLGLAVLAFAPGLHWEPDRSARTVAGLALAAWAVAGHPALVWVFGRPGHQAEWLALAPDPTALATLAMLLLLGESRHRFTRAWQRALWVPPLLWCAVTSLTLWTLGEAQAGVMAALAALAVLVGMLRVPGRT